MPSDRDGLLKHGLWLFAATQIANACNLFFHVVMGRGLPPAEYSALSTLLNIMLVIGTPLEALRTSIAHFAAKASATGETGMLRPVIRSWSIKLLAVGLPLSLAGCAGSAWIAAYFHLPTVWPVIIMSLTITGLLFIPLLAGALQGVQAFGWMALSLQGLSVVRLGLGWLLIATWSVTALSGVIAQFVGVALALAIGFAGLARILPRSMTSTAEDAVGSYFSKALIMLAGYAVLMNMDIVLVRHYFVEESKMFAQAATISRSIIFLPMPIALAMFPKVIGSESGRSTFLKALAIVFALVAGGVAACLLIPQVPLQLMYKNSDPEAIRMVRLVILAMSPLGLTYLLMNYAMARHRFRAGIPLAVCAITYVGGVMLWHNRIENVITMLAIATVSSLLVFLAGRPWREDGV